MSCDGVAGTVMTTEVEEEGTRDEGGEGDMDKVAGMRGRESSAQL